VGVVFRTELWEAAIEAICVLKMGCAMCRDVVVNRRNCSQNT
jgi:hypothetical protein